MCPPCPKHVFPSDASHHGGAWLSEAHKFDIPKLPFLSAAREGTICVFNFMICFIMYVMYDSTDFMETAFLRQGFRTLLKPLTCGAHSSGVLTKTIVRNITTYHPQANMMASQ